MKYPCINEISPEFLYGKIKQVLAKQNIEFKDNPFQELFPKLSGYTTTYNCIENHYPFMESIGSMLECCDEVVVADGGSTDGTYEKLLVWASANPKLQVYQNVIEQDNPTKDGDLKAFARALTSGEFLLQCVTPNTKIMTPHGEKEIKDIQVGEEVLTHKGRFRKVLKTYSRPTEKTKVFNIKKLGDNRTLTITDNHPIYFFNKEQNKFVWKTIENFDKSNDGFVYPKLSLNENINYNIEISHNKQAREKFTLIPDFKLGYLLGLYLGDGWVTKDRDKWQYISFSLSNYQDYVVENIKKYVSELFGINNLTVLPEGNKNAIRVQIGNQGLAEWFYSIAKTGSGGKQLDKSVFNWNKDALLGLLKGYYESDGSDDEKYCKIDSINNRLLSQVKLILTKCNLFGSLSSYKHKAGFSSFASKTEKVYRLAFSGKQLNEIKYLGIGEKLKDQQKQFFVESQDGFFFSAFTEIVSLEYSGELCNLEVEEDNSYVANGIVVHNCDVDEVIHERDYIKFRKWTKQFPKEADIICLPVVELFGNEKTVTARRHLWKWRLSRNSPMITHGLPNFDKIVDETTGKIHSKGGTDGCFYINISTGEMMPAANFWNEELEILRKTNPEKFAETMNNIFQELPSVHHYSWCDLPRKIKSFNSVWDRWWQTLFNKAPEPRFPNLNTEEEILNKAKELASAGGEPQDEIKYTFNLKINPPVIMSDWLKEAKLIHE